MKKILLALALIVFGYVLGIFSFVMFSHTPVSDVTGGHGHILSGGMPVAGATVSITDKGGTLSASTDSDGKFDIAVDSSRQLYLSMSNPGKHFVTMTVASHGSKLLQVQFEKKSLGENYFDLGSIDVNPPH